MSNSDQKQLPEKDQGYKSIPLHQQNLSRVRTGQSGDLFSSGEKHSFDKGFAQTASLKEEQDTPPH